MAIDQYDRTADPMSVAGPSDASRHHVNPQLGPEPWFDFPKPTYSQLDEELPPYFEQENVSLGLMLERMTTKGYAELRGLLEHSLPTSPLQHRPRLIIEYAKAQRQAFLKYLAILRWKAAVDVPVSLTAQSSQSHPANSFPTPQTNGSNGESSTTSPAADYNGKGKGKAFDQDEKKPLLARGKVTDAKRVTLLMEHQNRQHDETIAHISHITVIVDGLRERNPDLLTAISLLSKGTYDRLPTSLTKPYQPIKPLSNRTILRTLRRLNRHLLYRLRCVDHLPPELIIEGVRDGKVHISSWNQFGWRAQMTVVGFGEGDESRWWLTGLEWGWKSRQRGTDDPGGIPKLTEEEREQILELVNSEILVPKPVIDIKQGAREEKEKADAPLNRLYNFLEHLSLSYQLETLFIQAMELSQGRWRGHLLVDLDRQEKCLKLRYWIRQRPVQPTPQANPAMKRLPQQSLGAARTPLVGGTLRIALEESKIMTRDGDDPTDDVCAATRPSDRIVNLELAIKWEVGEGGVGGGLKSGVAMDSSVLQIEPSNLSLQDLLQTATRAHAAHLTRALTQPLLASPRIALFPLNLPSIEESDAEDKPLYLRIPLPSRQKSSALTVSISSLTGLIEIEDEGATDVRAGRARITSNNVNEHRSRLLDDLGRLMTAVIAETLESQMRQLGWAPVRRLALRSDELNRNDLHPATSIFVSLPTSPLHHFMAKLGPQGITFELLKLARTKSDRGLGLKLSVADKIPLDLVKMRKRRAERRTEGDFNPVESMLGPSTFEVDSRDLRELFVFCNALVAQTMIEQQLKDRSIPYTLQYPPPSGRGAATSKSAVAGMIPTICTNVNDLLKEDRANDVALPPVYIQLRDWWKGGKCGVVTIVQLRHKPALASSDAASSADHEDISFDPKTSVVRFLAKDVGNCVPLFLERWERLSKVLVVAGEVTRLNKTGSFKDLQVIAFDLRTVSFSYAAGYSAAITYTPQDDSYEASFSADKGTNPHELLAGLLSHQLNEMTQQTMRAGQKSRGERFISLLCSTLPFLQEVESLRSGGQFPALVVKSVNDFRLVWDVQNTRRYIIDVMIRSNRFLLIDGSIRSDPSCGPLTPFPNWNGIISKTYETLQKQEKENQQGTEVKEKGRQNMPIKLDDGNSLLCPVDCVREALRVMMGGVKGSIGI